MMAEAFSLDTWMGDQLSVEPMITYTTLPNKSLEFALRGCG